MQNFLQNKKKKNKILLFFYMTGCNKTLHPVSNCRKIATKRYIVFQAVASLQQNKTFSFTMFRFVALTWKQDATAAPLRPIRYTGAGGLTLR